MQSQPILMITMAIVVATHGTTLATLNQMTERVSDFPVFGILRISFFGILRISFFWHGAVN